MPKVVQKTGLPVMVQMAAARRDKAIVTMTVTVAMVSSATMIGDSTPITAKQDQPRGTIPGDHGASGQNAPSAVAEPAPEPGLAGASDQLMAEMSARPPYKSKRKDVMLRLAGLTLGNGHHAP